MVGLVGLRGVGGGDGGFGWICVFTLRGEVAKTMNYNGDVFTQNNADKTDFQRNIDLKLNIKHKELILSAEENTYTKCQE